MLGNMDHQEGLDFGRGGGEGGVAQGDPFRRWKAFHRPSSSGLIAVVGVPGGEDGVERP